MTARRSDDAIGAGQLVNRRIVRWIQGIGLALLVATGIQCSDKSSATAPQIQIQKRASFSMVPRFATLPAGLSIDLSKMRGLLIGASGDTVATEAVFQGDSAVLVFTVHFTGSTGKFNVDLTAYDKLGQVAFHGRDTVTVKPGDNPPVVSHQELQYAGPDAGVTKIQVVPNPVNLDAGATAGLGITGFNAAGQQVNTAVRASWLSRAPSIAAVDVASGIVSAGASEGSTWIVATSATGAVDSALVSVHAPVATFTVTPNPALVVRSDSLQLTAVMKDASGHTITGRSVTWLINDQTVATVGSAGLLKGKTLGTATVSAIVVGAAGKSVDVPVQVVSPVARIDVSSKSVTLNALGEQSTLGITIVPQGTAKVSGIPVSVTVADPTVVSMDTSHVITALKNGSTSITIKADVFTVTVPVTVKQVAKSVTVSPKTFASASQGDHVTFTAAIVDSMNVPVVGAKPTWSSSNVGSAMVDASGNATTVLDGTAVISASYGGLSDGGTITVNRVPVRLSIYVPADSVGVGKTMVATAAIVDGNGYAFPSAITWKSSDPTVISVDPGGGLSGIAAGTASLQATSGSASTSIVLRVTAAGGSAIPGTVLIYGPSMVSWLQNEQSLATAAGLKVTVATADQWSAMTASDFAKYAAIVFGDPDCSSGTWNVTTAAANKNVWSSVAKGPAVVIGTDPIYHQAPDGLKMVQNGIKYAASTTMTGLYADLSCYYFSNPPGTLVDFLTGVGNFYVVGQYYAGVDINHVTIMDPTHAVMQGVTSSGLSNWGNSVHEAFQGVGGVAAYPSSFHILAVSGYPPSVLPYVIAR